MKSLGGLIGGVAGGVVGAAVWAGISYGTGYEIAWIAWGIGLLVGFGFVVGNRGEGGVHAGLGAVAVTILAILGGKYATVELAIRSEVGTRSAFIDSTLAALADEEFVISYLADEVVEERTSRGETIAWPRGVDPAEAAEEADYPAEIWAVAESSWGGMSEQERQAYRDELAEGIRHEVGAFYDEAIKVGFTDSFAALDLLFFGLAILTAYRIAGRRAPQTAESPEG